MSVDSNQSLVARSVQLLRAHPVITCSMILMTVVPALAGLVWLNQDWPAWRRLAAGATAGFGVGLIITMSRMLGAFTEKE